MSKSELDYLADDADDGAPLQETEVVVKFPETVGECIDMLYNKRAERLQLSKLVKDGQAIESALKKHIIAKLTEVGLDGGKGKEANLSIKTTDVPTPKDWAKIHAYIVEHNAFDMLQKRLSTTAVAERWAIGEEVPGIEHFEVKDVSLTKRGK